MYCALTTRLNASCPRGTSNQWHARKSHVIRCALTTRVNVKTFTYEELQTCDVRHLHILLCALIIYRYFCLRRILNQASNPHITCCALTTRLNTSCPHGTSNQWHARKSNIIRCALTTRITVKDFCVRQTSNLWCVLLLLPLLETDSKPMTCV